MPRPHHLTPLGFAFEIRRIQETSWSQKNKKKKKKVQVEQLFPITKIFKKKKKENLIHTPRY
jgi:hypothetical protein